ncbi:MAG: hypothetical protein AVO39_05475 [delta proteobacterium MLS_D]|jgi:uncharacterized protein YbbK (DUF523 family)|nr:MAG: hypothetical protein AVO39_05475 [delta proteobacterium MLS_D]
MILVSACLLGLDCRYDGSALQADRTVEGIIDDIMIPVCPEQMGGLPTPRSPSEITEGDGNDVLDGTSRVLNSAGEDVTVEFLKGARMTLSVARIAGVKRAIMKERSPSCGVLHITRNREGIPGMGVAAALLKRAGIQVVSSDRIIEDYVRYHRHWK